VLEIPLYRIFTDGARVKVPKRLTAKNGKSSWGTSGKDRCKLMLLLRSFRRMDDRHQKIILAMAQKMAARRPVDAAESGK
jgi:hypothetical protein